MAKRNVVKEIRKATRRQFSAEEKIRVVLEAGYEPEDRPNHGTRRRASRASNP